MNADTTVGTATEQKRTPHTIRFLGPEWDRIEAHAQDRGLTAAEFVRFATLAAVADGPGGCRHRAPLVETTFRGTHVLMSALRDRMREAGEPATLEKWVRTARAYQDELLGKPLS